jgi:hypothetical protein
MLVPDFGLRLVGMTIVKDAPFTTQELRLPVVAFLWHRVHEADGTLRLADAVRRISRPVEAGLRGDSVDADFFGSAHQAWIPSREAVSGSAGNDGT